MYILTLLRGKVSILTRGDLGNDDVAARAIEDDAPDLIPFADGGATPGPRDPEHDRRQRGEHQQQRELEDIERIDRAKAIWAKAQDPRGTAVEQYLASRKLSLPSDLGGTCSIPSGVSLAE